MNKQQSGLKEKMQLLIDSVPGLQRNHPKWEQCVAQAGNAKWAKALSSLIEMAVSSEFYFSEQFWTIACETAQVLNRKEQTAECQKQIARLKHDQVTLPFGWTSKKTGAGIFEAYTSRKLQEDWDTERRRKDGLESLVNKEGFHFKPHGKMGYVYYVNLGRITEVEWHEGEIEGSTFSKYWVYPEKCLLTDHEYQRIYSELKEWAALKNISFRY